MYLFLFLLLLLIILIVIFIIYLIKKFNKPIVVIQYKNPELDKKKQDILDTITRKYPTTTTIPEETLPTRLLLWNAQPNDDSNIYYTVNTTAQSQSQPPSISLTPSIALSSLTPFPNMIADPTIMKAPTYLDYYNSLNDRVYNDELAPSRATYGSVYSGISGIIKFF